MISLGPSVLRVGSEQEAPLGLFPLLSMEPPSFVRRRKTAAERRAQRHRSEARFLQRALNGLNDVHSRRGGTLTRFGCALRDALTRFSAGTDVPHSPSSCPSVPGLSPHSADAELAPAHGVPADDSVPSADHSIDASDDHLVSSVMSISEAGVTYGEPVCVPTLECPSYAGQVSTGPQSMGSGDEPDLMLPQQLVGTSVSHAVQRRPVLFPGSTPADFPLAGEGAQSHCFFVVADVRSCGAASKFALVTVHPFFIMIKSGLSFIQAELAVAPEDPPKEIKPHSHDGTGGVKVDCNQQ